MAMEPSPTPEAMPAPTAVVDVDPIAEQLRNDGFEVLANGPDSMRKRIELEVPKWRDVINKAGIKRV